MNATSCEETIDDEGECGVEEEHTQDISPGKPNPEA